jgi:hypothetical protein
MHFFDESMEPQPIDLEAIFSKLSSRDFRLQKILLDSFGNVFGAYGRDSRPS